MRTVATSCLVIAVFCCPTLVSAQDRPPPQTAAVKRASELLDGWTGRSDALEEARQQLASAIARRTDEAWAHREMARYHIMSGYVKGTTVNPTSLASARKELDAAIAIDPNFAQAYVLDGHLSRLMRLPERARASLAKAEQLGSRDPWLFNNRADLLVDEGKYAEAIPDFERVIALPTPNQKAIGAAYEGLIRSYMQLRQADKAEATYERLIAHDPKAPWPYGNYARFLLCNRDDFDRAVAKARQSLALMDYGMGRFVLASALYRKWADEALAGRPAATSLKAEADKLAPDAGGAVNVVRQTCGQSNALVKVRLAAAS